MERSLDEIWKREWNNENDRGRRCENIQSNPNGLSGLAVHPLLDQSNSGGFFVLRFVMNSSMEMSNI